jgi:hypothetical protein
MRHSTIGVRTTADLYFVVTTPCGKAWTGMTHSNDLPIQVRKALEHADSCATCAEINAATQGGTGTGSPSGGDVR